MRGKWAEGGTKEEIFAEDADFPQPDSLNGVTEDMATLAMDHSLLHPQGHGVDQGAGFGLQRGAFWDEDAERRNGRSSGEEGFAEEHGAAVAATEASSEGPTDAEIMLRVRDGDDSGFDFLIAKYRKPIIHFMYRMVHNQGVAEELAQEVFLRVYRSRATYRAEARFSTWLYRIATNLGVNHARDTKHERAASNVYLDEPDAETGTRPDLADSTPSAEQDLLRKERMQAIRQHVMALPERQRAAVLMHKYEGMDYKQIGEVLKLSESATKSLLFRAYQSLREKLKNFV
ncbi:MAG: RNA polymerase sigma factor [Acidobacteriaceae bacterium]